MLTSCQIYRAIILILSVVDLVAENVVHFFVLGLR